jgi:hypothetical protein
MLGTCLLVWDINAHSDKRAETESKIKTSAPDVPTSENASGTQGETPETLNPPLRTRSLARVSRNNRLLAIKNTETEQLGTGSLHQEALIMNRSNLVPQNHTYGTINWHYVTTKRY